VDRSGGLRAALEVSRFFIVMQFTLHHPLLRKAQLRLRDESGVALVEFALILPIFALMMFGALDLGKAYNYWIDETQLAHEGARWAAVNKSPETGVSLVNAIRNQADTSELKNGATSSVPNPLQVCVYLPDGPSIGGRVRVEVSSSYQFMSFVASKINVLEADVVAHSTMRLERPPTTYSDGDCA
jgi:Flp pilus assembly protein TadG